MSLKSKDSYVYVGGWAGNRGSACGIQAFSYDSDTRKLSYLDTFGEYKSMANVIIHGYMLFACVESKADDLILSYKIQPDGSLTQLDCVHTGDFNIAALALDPEGGYLFACSLPSCCVNMLHYDDNGKLSLTDRYQVTDPGSYMLGHSPYERQGDPHVHYAHVMPGGTHICLCSMGNDKIYILELDRTNGKLIPCPQLTAAIDNGEGPRHIVFSPNGKFAYMNTEMGNTVYVFSVGEDNSLTQLQKLSTLNPDISNPAKGWCSVIIMSPDGKYVYVGNRGQNNIAGFRIEEDGLLSCIGFFDCYGSSPRGLNFGPNEEVLFCSNNSSNSLSVIAFNKESGALGKCLQLIETIPGCASTAWCVTEK